MNDLLLFGLPGAGKGTQAELILEKTGEKYSHISTGNVFRSLLSKPNAIGRYVSKQMEKGELVNDQVTISLFNAYFYTVIDEGRVMLLDGYPRSLVQMKSFLELAETHKRKLTGLYFDLSEEETIKRMMGRAREGEDKAVMEARLKEYYEKTQPIVELFKEAGHTLITIDASPSIEEIHTHVMKFISE